MTSGKTPAGKTFYPEYACFVSLPGNAFSGMVNDLLLERRRMSMSPGSSR
jgi:hypothetical protein